MKTFFAVIGAVVVAVFVLPIVGIMAVAFWFGLSSTVGSNLKTKFDHPYGQANDATPTSQTTVVARITSPDVTIKRPRSVPASPSPPPVLPPRPAPRSPDAMAKLLDAESEDPAINEFIGDGGEDVSKGDPVVAPAPPPVPTSAPSSTAPLHVVSWKCTTDDFTMKVEGLVTNVSSHRIETPLVIGEFYSSDGGFITSGTGFTDYGSLLPGQSSPFSASAMKNPEMSNCKLGFRSLLGGALAASG